MTKMIWLVNNLRNIFMSGNSQKYYSKIIITYQINLLQKNIDIQKIGKNK